MAEWSFNPGGLVPEPTVVTAVLYYPKIPSSYPIRTCILLGEEKHSQYYTVALVYNFNLITRGRFHSETEKQLMRTILVLYWL